MKLGNEKPACRRRTQSAGHQCSTNTVLGAVVLRRGVELCCFPGPSAGLTLFPASWTATACGGSWLEPGPRASSLAAHVAASYQGAWFLLVFPLLMSPAASLRATPLLSLPLLASVGTSPHLPDATPGIFHRPASPHSHPKETPDLAVTSVTLHLLSMRRVSLPLSSPDHLFFKIH